MVMRFVLKQRSRRCQKGYCLQRGVAQNSLPRNIRRREREELGQCWNEAYDNVVSKEAGAIVRGEVLNDQTRKRDSNLLRCDAQSEGTVSASELSSHSRQRFQRKLGDCKRPVYLSIGRGRYETEL